jgi:hypothetical protein
MVFALEAFSSREQFRPKALECTLPPDILARHDEGGGARDPRAMGEVSICRADDNEKREYCEKVDLSGIVTVVADFPAHCLCTPCGSTKSMRL